MDKPTTDEYECFTCWVCNVTIEQDLLEGGHDCWKHRKPRRVDMAIEAVSPRHANHDVRPVARKREDA